MIEILWEIYLHYQPINVKLLMQFLIPQMVQAVSYYQNSVVFASAIACNVVIIN